MIYRVENEKGEGPYYQKYVGYAIENCGRNPFRHPLPSSEGWHGHTGVGEVFGFTSKEQLERWFRQADLWALADEGYHVVTYDIEPHWQSETQCTFFK